jgi:hypothetical protein
VGPGGGRREGALRSARARIKRARGRLELGLPDGNARTVAKGAVEVPEPRVLELNEWVRVLPATAPGLLPRLATGCGEATVVDFDFATRTRAYVAECKRVLTCFSLLQRASLVRCHWEVGSSPLSTRLR